MLASALVSFEMRRFAPPDACYRPFQGSSLKHLESGGRKNHYGSRSRRGTEVAALYYSLMETAKLCGVDPKRYLREAALAALAWGPYSPAQPARTAQRGLTSLTGFCMS